MSQSLVRRTFGMRIRRLAMRTISEAIVGVRKVKPIAVEAKDTMKHHVSEVRKDLGQSIHEGWNRKL